VDKRIAQNALNFLLSDRFTYKGPDTLPLVEIVRELTTAIGDGATTNTEGGAPKTKDE